VPQTEDEVREEGVWVAPGDDKHQCFLPETSLSTCASLCCLCHLCAAPPGRGRYSRSAKKRDANEEEFELEGDEEVQEEAVGGLDPEKTAKERAPFVIQMVLDSFGGEDSDGGAWAIGIYLEDEMIQRPYDDAFLGFGDAFCCVAISEGGKIDRLRMQTDEEWNPPGKLISPNTVERALKFKGFARDFEELEEMRLTRLLIRACAEPAINKWVYPQLLKGIERHVCITFRDPGGFSAVSDKSTMTRKGARMDEAMRMALVFNRGFSDRSTMQAHARTIKDTGKVAWGSTNATAWQREGLRRYHAEQRLSYEGAKFIAATADKSRISRRGTFAGAIHAPLEAPKASWLPPQVTCRDSRVIGRRQTPFHGPWRYMLGPIIRGYFCCQSSGFCFARASETFCQSLWHLSLR
jgi:hypothetical protein